VEKHQSNTQPQLRTSSKRCPKCDEVKPFEEFNKNRSSTDGLQAYCRPCQQQESKKYFNEKPEHVVLGGMKSRSRNKGLCEVEWTVEEVREKLQGCCEVTGFPFDNNRNPETWNMCNPFCASPDRIDSTKGYTKDNTRWVVWIFNLMCSNFSDEQVKQFIEHLRNNEVNL